METSPGDEEDTKICYDTEKQICRCCLTTEKRMKSAVDVQEYFMELTGLNVSMSDGMPLWVCIECSALMRKAIAFKYKMLRAHSVLYEHLAKCTRGPVDPTTPDLARYRTPQLSVTQVLTFDSSQENIGYFDILQHEKEVLKSDLHTVPLLPMFETPQTAFEGVEAAFSDFGDDPLEEFRYVKTERVDLEEENTEEEMEDEELDDDSDDDSDDVKSEPDVKISKSVKGPQKTKIEDLRDELLNITTDVSWTSENDRVLIEFVRSNESLYNPKNELYKITVLKQKLWRDIGVILNKTESDCYKRWCYVRDYYIRRRGKARGGEAAKRRAQLLAFLDSVPSPQRSWVVPSSNDEDVKMESQVHVNVEPDPWDGIRIGDQHSKMSPNKAWNIETDEVLIELVRRNEALYNTRCKEFRKVLLKQKLWKDIGLKLNKTDTDCYKRWCYVRDYYVRRKANPGALSTGKAAKRRAERLSFLDAMSSQRPAVGTHHDNETLKLEMNGSSPTKINSTEGMQNFTGFTHQRYRFGIGYRPKSSSVTWTSDNDDVLIEFVRNHDVLYNPKSKDFRKAYLKQKLWIDIGRKLNKTDTDCCRRWCYVRDYYIRRRGKAGVLSTGRAAKRRADRLYFLDDVQTSSKTRRADQEGCMKSERSQPPHASPRGGATTTDYEQEQPDQIQLADYPNISTNVCWTSEDDEKLIGFVRGNKALYDYKCRRTDLKQRLWSDIGSMLNKTDCDCYKRWCYVRDYYIRRRGKARGGEAAKRRAQLLSFLD